MSQVLPGCAPAPTSRSTTCASGGTHRPGSYHRARGDAARGDGSAPGQWAGGFRRLGRAGGLPGTGRGSVVGRALRVVSPDLKAWTNALDPFGAHLIAGVFPHRSHSRDRPAGERRPGRSRDAGGGAGARAEQSRGTGRAEPSTPSAKSTTSSSRPLAAGLLRRSGPSSSSHSTACAARSCSASAGGAGRRHGPGRPGGRVVGLGWLSADVGENWSIAPPMASASLDAAWCERAADQPGEALEPGLAWLASS